MLIGLLIIFPCSLSYAVPGKHHLETCCTEEFDDILPADPFNSKSVVEEVQKALLMTGFYFGEITGKYDEMTVNAVKAFQKEMGLAVNGIVRYHVWLKLAGEAEKVMA
ncbi:MAG: peptidoglycan-binding domain-containing protein, partial [Bacillota bacterium]